VLDTPLHVQAPPWVSLSTLQCAEVLTAPREENGMSESAAALVRTIAAVARPDARPPEDQVRAL
jgi:hypothetical protein